MTPVSALSLYWNSQQNSDTCHMQCCLLKVCTCYWTHWKWPQLNVVVWDPITTLTLTVILTLTLNGVLSQHIPAILSPILTVFISTLPHYIVNLTTINAFKTSLSWRGSILIGFFMDWQVRQAIGHISSELRNQLELHQVSARLQGIVTVIGFRGLWIWLVIG